MNIKRIGFFLTVVAISCAATAQTPMKNGLPYLPDEILLGSGMPYFHRTAPKQKPDIDHRAPVDKEIGIVDRANRLVADSEIKMMAMVDDGKIVNIAYRAPASETSTFMSASMIKSVTAMSAGVAVCEGKLSLDTKVKDVVKDLAAKDIGEATLKDLLTMRSGTLSATNAGISETAAEMAARYRGDMALIDHIKIRAGNAQTKMFGKTVKPGESFDYKGQDPIVVAMMVSAAYGSDNGTGFGRWQEENFFTKTGTADTVIIGQDTKGYADAGSNIRMTGNDWIRYGTFVQKSRKEAGCYGDYTRSATSTQVKTDRQQLPQFNGFGYYFWTENEFVPDAYATVGYGGQFIIWSTKSDKFIVVFANTGKDTRNVYSLAKEWFATN